MSEEKKSNEINEAEGEVKNLNEQQSATADATDKVEDAARAKEAVKSDEPHQDTLADEAKAQEEQVEAKEEKTEAHAPTAEIEPAAAEETSTTKEETPDATQVNAAEAAESSEDARKDEPEAKPSETVTDATKDTTEQTEDSSEDDDHEDQDDDEELPDYETYSRERLAETIEDISHWDKFKKIDRVLAEILPLFEEMEAARRAEALEKFLKDGGDEDSFEYRHDELYERFDASFRLIRDKKSSFYKERAASKEQNLAKKQALLDQLRAMVDGEATTSIKPIKEIQEAWKAIGAVAPQHNKTLWANYNALLDRFYNNRHILFELKELDRKKNQQAKEELCAKAEELLKLDNLKDAIFKLNELHEEYKHIGPVPREVQEDLWQRFKAASDTIYVKRKEHLDELKEELKVNIPKKEALIEELKAFVNFEADQIGAWNKKTKEILAIQKQWEAIGGIPRENAKKINKAFWASFKTFFANKNKFFKGLEEVFEDNLKKKEVLIEKAHELKDAEDFDKTAEQMKQLQRDWKKIGPVPEKQSQSSYKKFKSACDHFFNRKRDHQGQAEMSYQANLKEKEAVIEQMLEEAKTENGTEAALMAFAEQFKSIGFVPKSAMKSIDVKFKKASEAYAKALGIPEDERETAQLKSEMIAIQKGGGHRGIEKKEAVMRKKINELEENIGLWRNNLTFFANSKTADKLKTEFDEKIVKAQEEVKQLKKQLKVLRSL